MKAIVYEQYGSPDVLEYKEVEKPAPKDNEVLIKVRASSVNFADWGMLTGEPFMVRFWSGLSKPKNKILGLDVAGRIEAVGKKVKQFKVGDDVFGELGSSGLGAYAQYVCTTEEKIVIKPANVSFENAATAPVAAITALQGLRYKGQIEAGQKVLVNGASGGVGTFAVLIAKAWGAQVTAVCSTGKIDMVRDLGADHVIDYTKEDFTKKDTKYDLIIGANGHHSIFDYKKALNPNGRYVCTGGSGGQIAQSMFLGPLISMFGNKLLGNMGVATVNKKDLTIIGDLMATGKVKPVIEKRYPLSETADALRYLGERHAHGKLVIVVE